MGKCPGLHIKVSFFFLPDGCLSIPDASGAWKNLTDSDLETCVTIPRDNPVEHLQAMKLDLMCASASNDDYSMKDPEVPVNLVVQPSDACRYVPFMFSEITAGCNGGTIRLCRFVMMGSGVCQFKCQCPASSKTCTLYVAQSEQLLPFNSSV